MTVINIAVLAVAYPIYLHFLGYEKYGVWLVLATVLSFAQLGNLGIGQAVMKLVAEEYGRDDIEGVQRYVATALALLCFSGAVALVVILALKNQIVAAFNLSDENASTVLWLLPYIGILSIYVFAVQTMNATLSGLGRMDLANWTQSAGRIVAVVTAVFLLYGGRGIESLLIGNTLSYVLVHIVSLILIRRIAPVRLLRTANLSIRCCKRLLSFGLGLFGGSLMSLLLSPFNKLMLSRYAGVSSIPVYEIAYNGGMQIRALVEAGLRAVMPEVSRISRDLSGTRERILRLYHRLLKFILIFFLPLCGGLILLSARLLSLWLGQRFVEELPAVFNIMLVGVLISLLGVPAYYTLMGLGMVRHTFAANAILSCTSVLVIMLIVLSGRQLSVKTVSWAFLVAAAVSSLYLHWKITQRVLRHCASRAIALAESDNVAASRD